MTNGTGKGLVAFILRYKLEHLIFWIVYIFFWVLLSGRPGDPKSYINSTAVIFFHMLVSYFNIYLLIPRLLQLRKYMSYSISLLLSLVLVSFPQIITIYLLNREVVGNPENIWNLKFFAVNILTTLYTVSVTMIIHLMIQWYQREKEKKELLQLNAETELKFLKSQINPHFLFNCLNTIYALSLKKSEDTPETVLKLSEMLRYILYEVPNKRVKLENEVNYIKNYIAIEKLRTGNRASIEFTEEITHPELTVEPMLLIPFVENGFKHGINRLTNEVWFNIRLVEREGVLLFEATNSKVLNGKPGEHGGIGIYNVKQRLKMLYPDKHELQVTENENQYQVFLKIDLL